jgi:hypothetical protein
VDSIVGGWACINSANVLQHLSIWSGSGFQIQRRFHNFCGMPLRCIHVLLAVLFNDDVPCAVVVAISMQTVLVHVYDIRVPIPWTFWDLCTCHKFELVVQIGVRMFWERTPHRNVPACMMVNIPLPLFYDGCCLCARMCQRQFIQGDTTVVHGRLLLCRAVVVTSCWFLTQLLLVGGLVGAAFAHLVAMRLASCWLHRTPTAPGWIGAIG